MPARGKRTTSRSPRANISAQPTASSPATAPAQEQDAPATIRKGIYLSALVYIEGDQPPAQNFADPATSALKDALTQAFSTSHAGLKMSLKRVEVRNNVEDENSDSQPPKFQF